MPLVSLLGGNLGYGRVPSKNIPPPTPPPPGPTNKNVLLLWDVDNAATADLVTYLTTNGFVVTKSSRNAWTSTNPALTNFGSVIMLNGTTFSTNLNTTAQTALVNFVKAGGKFINGEWDAYQVSIGYLSNMIDLVLAVRSSGSQATRKYTISSGYSSHPLFSGLSSPIAIPNTGFNVGGVRSFSTSPVTVIATDESGNAAVIIRTLNSGKIVYLNQTANYSANVLNDANVKRLYLNALNW